MQWRLLRRALSKAKAPLVDRGSRSELFAACLIDDDGRQETEDIEETADRLGHGRASRAGPTSHGADEEEHWEDGQAEEDTAQSGESSAQQAISMRSSRQLPPEVRAAMVATLAERQSVVLIAGRRANDLAFRLVALSEIGIGAAVRRAILASSNSEAVEVARLRPVENERIREALSSRFIAFGIARWMMRALCRGMTSDGGGVSSPAAEDKPRMRSSHAAAAASRAAGAAVVPFGGAAAATDGTAFAHGADSQLGGGGDADLGEAESEEDEARMDDTAAEREDADQDEIDEEEEREGVAAVAPGMTASAVWTRCVAAAKAVFQDRAYSRGAIDAAAAAIKAKRKRRLSQLTMLEQVMGVQSAVPEEDAAKAAVMAARAAVKAVASVSRVVASALGLQLRDPSSSKAGKQSRGSSEDKLTHAQRAGRAAELLVLSEQLALSARGLELKGRVMVCSVVEGSRATTALEVFTAITASDAVLRARAGVIVAGVDQQRTAARLRRLAGCIEEAGILAGPALPQRAVWRRGFEDASLLRLAAGPDAAVADAMLQSRTGRSMAGLIARKDRIAALQQGKVAGVTLRERVMLSARLASERLRSMGKEAALVSLLGVSAMGAEDDDDDDDDGGGVGHDGDQAEQPVSQTPQNTAEWGSDSDSDDQEHGSRSRKRREPSVAVQGLAMSLEAQRRPGAMRVFRG
jgi:hypothetical protein